jgi:gluconate 2-dehydrogenase gamma chain
MKDNLSRRSAIQRFSYLVGGAVATPTLLSVLQSCQKAPVPLDWSPAFLDDAQSRLVSTLSEMIVPRTDTPGALDAGVPQFIDQILAECLSDSQRQLFLDGLDNLNSISRETHGDEFTNVSPKNQTELLKQIAIQGQGQADSTNRYSSGPQSFFMQLKQLTLLGYFTSERGATEALAFVQIPGSYEGCTTLEAGQKSWAE